ncbi:hypothetical protein ElyMa_001389200 [Elysia marginata]|uniref:Uncharacterized protein n=1 Tax=Elysia marginata TaxID=1093978 RepID=A0AAV4IUT3_9GAST|nr:hypothetical protein ElyMa_001389200 [Elysia marginata]
MKFFGHINRHDGLEKLMLHGKGKEDALAVDNDRLSWVVCLTFMDSLSRFINISHKSLSTLSLTYSDRLKTERLGNPRSSMSAPDLTPRRRRRRTA